MVSIKDERTKKKPFGAVVVGDMFEYDGVLYMKMQTNGSAIHNAVVMANGLQACFSNSVDVWVANVTVTINA